MKSPPVSALRSPRSRWRSSRGILTLMVFLLALAVSVPLQAQTLFTWPSPMPDVARHTNVDDCLAAVRRVSDSMGGRSPVWADTLPYFPAEEVRQKLPARAIETAARCSNQLNIDTVVPFSAFGPMLRLLLIANRDDDAELFIARQLAAGSAIWDLKFSPKLSADSLRLALLDTAIEAFWVRARPIRLARGMPYLEQRLLTPGTTLIERVMMAAGIGKLAYKQGDTALSRRWFERAVEIATTVDRHHPLYPIGQQMVLGILIHLHLTELADSLRVGTDAYVRQIERMWAAIDAGGNTKLPRPYGVHAPLLQAEYWFETQGGTTKDRSTSRVRPVPGRTSLVVFIPTGWKHPGDGWLQGYILKRLKQRFPALEIILMTQTRGYVGPLEPPSPEQEAEIYRKRLLDHLQWPVTLGVANTPWWRLDGLDRRRINQPVVSRQEYTFGSGKTLDDWMTFLIDPDGRVVLTDWLGRFDHPHGIPGDMEERLGVLIQTLMERSSSQQYK
jgi:hypothetical protein